MENLFQRVSVT